MKQALVAASLILVGGAATGCGGPPTNASTDEFCAEVDEFYAEVDSLDEDAREARIARALADLGVRLQQVGTPPDIPEEARKGFEVTIQAIGDLSRHPRPDPARLAAGLDEDEQEQTDAFDLYLVRTCRTPGGDEA